jgi:flavin reductase
MMSAAMKVPDDMPLLSKEAFREGMSRLGAAVNIITTDGPAGRAGFTASAVCSVTDSPPTLLVCLNRSSSVHARFIENEALCVNTLAPGHEALSQLFGGKTPMDERFAAASWSVGRSGAPTLDDAAASFDCRITSKAGVGSHTVFFCEVLAVECHEVASGLIYFDRAYHRVRS